MLDFHKEQTPSGVRFTLPPRVATPKMRIMGGFLMVFGLAIALFACGWMWMPLQWALTDPTPVGPEASGHGMPLFFRIFFCAFAAFGLMPLGIGLAMGIAGLALIIGGSYCRIDLEPHRLLVREQFAFLHWTFRRKIKDITALVLGSQEEGSFPGRDFIAQSSGKKSLVIAPGYPIPFIRRLAQELHQELPDIPLRDEMPTPQAPLERFTPSTPNPVKAVPVEPSIPDPGPPPPGVLCDIRSHGVTLDVQAPGIWKGARFFVIFSSLWLFFTTAITIPLILAIIGVIPTSSDSAPPWLALLFMSLFWAVGLGMFAAAVHIGTRRTTITIGDGVLALTITSRLRCWHRQWLLQHLSEVWIGPSGIEVNECPISCLHLRIGGRTTKILPAYTQEAEQCLNWIATILSSAFLRTKDSAPGEMPQSLRCVSEDTEFVVEPLFVWRNYALYGVFWSLPVGAVTMSVFVWKLLDKQKLSISAFVCLGIGLFSLWALCYSVWLLNIKRRISLSHDRLTIQEGNRLIDLDRSEIAAVTCETRYGPNTGYRLVIEQSDGTVLTCLSCRPETELRWLAAELTHRLKATSPHS